MLLVYMLPDVRTKPDSDRVVYFTQVRSRLHDEVSICQCYLTASFRVVNTAIFDPFSCNCYNIFTLRVLGTVTAL